MLDILLMALENFCIHQMRVPYQITSDVAQMRTVIASIEIELLDGKKQRVYLGATLDFAQRVATLLLEEEESDEQTLVDMMLETVNLIVGSAKVLAENTPYFAFNISTPNFEKIDIFDIMYDKAKVLKIQNDAIVLAIKEI
ncbi:MAG: chemotaxis protein CheX [Sulfurimonas sp.]|nr:chemotaxis protein CheX [Sulfurimonas sp.]